MIDFFADVSSQFLNQIVISYKLNIDFTFNYIKEEIAKQRKKDLEQVEVVFLSNLPRDYTKYSLVWKNELRDVMERGSRRRPNLDDHSVRDLSTSHESVDTPATLYYLIVKKTDVSNYRFELCFCCEITIYIYNSLLYNIIACIYYMYT